MRLHHQAAPVVCWRQQIVRENKWGGGGGWVHSISVLCVYFQVAIFILAGPFLKMIYHRKLEKFADVGGGASWVSK